MKNSQPSYFSWAYDDNRGFGAVVSLLASMGTHRDGSMRARNGSSIMTTAADGGS
jgi:hypothetical protein